MGPRLRRQVLGGWLPQGVVGSRGGSLPTFWQQKVGPHGAPRPALSPLIRHAAEAETSSKICLQPNHRKRKQLSKFLQRRRTRQRTGLGPSAEVLSFASPKDKYPKKRRPDCPRPCASLRANLRHAIQSAVRQNSLCAARAAQTRCRKSDHDALALFGANARSPNSVPQARPHG